MNTEDNLLERKVPVDNSLNSITPLSKWLAMILFISLPFVGGLVGYNYTLEKVVYVDEYVTPTDETIETPDSAPSRTSMDTSVTPVTVSHNDSSQTINSLMEFKVGDEFYGMEVIAIEPFSDHSCLDELCDEKIPRPMSEGNIRIKMVGEMTVRGQLWAPTGNPMDGGIGPKYGIDNVKLTKLLIDNPYIERFGILNKEIFETSDVQNRDTVEVVIGAYELVSYPAEVWDTAEILSIKKVQ